MLPYVSTTCLSDVGYRDTLDHYERAGIDRVELGYCPDPRIDVGAVVDGYPFQFIAHNYFRPVADEFVLNLASQNEEILTRSIDYVREAIDFCYQHGIREYTVHAGFRVDPDESFQFTADPVPPADRCLETFVESLRTLLPYAADRDVNLAIENNVVTHEHVINDELVVLLADPTEFAILLDRIEVDVLLDTGHLDVAAETIGFDRQELLDVIESHLHGIHLHTNDRTEDTHDPITRDDWAFTFWKRVDVMTTVESRFDDISGLIDHLDLLIEG